MPSEGDFPDSRTLIRFGIICPDSSLRFPAWQAQCLQRLLALEGVEAALLIAYQWSPGAAVAGPSHTRGSWQARFLWKAYQTLGVKRRARALQPAALIDLLALVPWLRITEKGASTHSVSFSGEAIESVRAANLDFILHFGPGYPPADIAAGTRYGVWTFRDGAGEALTDDSAFFWQVYRNQRVTRATLEQRTGQSANPVVLYEGFFKTIQSSLPRHSDEVLLGVVDWPARVCHQIQCRAPLGGGSSPPLPAGPGQRETVPTVTQLARMVCLTAVRFGVAACTTLGRADQWNIGIIDAPITKVLNPQEWPPVRWLPPPPTGTFLADPFAYGTGPGAVVLVEAFDYRSGKGVISAVSIEPGGTLSTPQVAIDEPVHLSYPYLVEHAGAIYCIPETPELRGVTLYRSTLFPHQWVKAATLIAGFAAVDTTVFRHGERWWLFCSEHAPPFNATLHAWHAPDLLGPWQPHRANPLKTDVRSSRPAGTPFVHDGQLYRPAQDCSRTYGGAVVINHVQRLTPMEFAEVPVARVEPDPRGPYPHGLHTLSAWGERTLVDGKRQRFIPRASWRLLRTALPQFRARGAAPAPQSVDDQSGHAYPLVPPDAFSSVNSTGLGGPTLTLGPDTT